MDAYASQVIWNEWMPLLRSAPVRLIAGLASLGYLGWLVRGLTRRRTGPLRVLLGGSCAVAGAIYAVHPDLLTWFASVPYLTRLRAAMALLSFTVFSSTMESLRRDELEARYAVLWLVTSLLILVAALFPQVVEVFRLLTGIEFTGAMTAVLVTFLVLVAFNFSLAFSRSRRHQSASAQRLAVLEQRVIRLEEALRRRGDGEGLLPPAPAQGNEPPSAST